NDWSLPATSIVISRPIFETRILPYSMQYRNWGSNPAHSSTYCVIGRYMYIDAIDSSGGTGGADSNSEEFSMPFDYKQYGSVTTKYDTGVGTLNSVGGVTYTMSIANGKWVTVRNLALVSAASGQAVTFK